jgi:hypothetical protein
MTLLLGAGSLLGPGRSQNACRGAPLGLSTVIFVLLFCVFSLKSILSYKNPMGGFLELVFCFFFVPGGREGSFLSFSLKS